MKEYLFLTRAARLATVTLLPLAAMAYHAHYDSDTFGDEDSATLDIGDADAFIDQVPRFALPIQGSFSSVDFQKLLGETVLTEVKDANGNKLEVLCGTNNAFAGDPAETGGYCYGFPLDSNGTITSNTATQLRIIPQGDWPDGATLVSDLTVAKQQDGALLVGALTLNFDDKLCANNHIELHVTRVDPTGQKQPVRIYRSNPNKACSPESLDKEALATGNNGDFLVAADLLGDPKKHMMLIYPHVQGQVVEQKIDSAERQIGHVAVAHVKDSQYIIFDRDSTPFDRNNTPDKGKPFSPYWFYQFFDTRTGVISDLTPIYYADDGNPFQDIIVNDDLSSYNRLHFTQQAAATEQYAVASTTVFKQSPADKDPHLTTQVAIVDLLSQKPTAIALPFPIIESYIKVIDGTFYLGGSIYQDNGDAQNTIGTFTDILYQIDPVLNQTYLVKQFASYNVQIKKTDPNDGTISYMPAYDYKDPDLQPIRDATGKIIDFMLRDYQSGVRGSIPISHLSIPSIWNVVVPARNY